MSPEVKSILSLLDVPAHRAWLVECTDEHLEEYIANTAVHTGYNVMAVAERQKRQLDKILDAQKEVHWTITPTFWVACFVAALTVAALIFAWYSWKHPQTPPPPNDKPALSSRNTALELGNSPIISSSSRSAQNNTPQASPTASTVYIHASTSAGTSNNTR